ncbi:hypothetical protein ACN9JG_21175 (plasmid) [Cereibacter azotoformans]|uniref:hypothetical protein n=1 Tax=Cereibacter azotoformans TaxID=43057 RepID=UPI003B2121A3
MLRSDIHALFDVFLVSIDPATGRLQLADRLRDKEFLDGLHDKPVVHRVARQSLDWHFKRFRRMTAPVPAF